MLKRAMIFLLDCLPVEWRDYLFGIKRFRSKKRIFPQKQTLIFFIENRYWHGGLTDRFKGIVSMFHYCLVKNMEFKISYSPVALSDFLLPNKYDWTINNYKSITYNHNEAKFVNFIGDGTIKRITRIKTKKQIHAFANRDITDLLNDYYKTRYTWGELFNQLFKPTTELQTVIDEKLKIIDGKYIGVVFRFQNLLGDFAEYDFKPLAEKEKTALAFRCKQAIIDLQNQENNNKILVTADSETFLKSLNNMPNIFSFPEKIVHIDNVENEAYSVYLKSFLDFYLLAESEKIYSIGTTEMYKSEFPLYAAKVNNIEFERILI